MSETAAVAAIEVEGLRKVFAGRRRVLGDHAEPVVAVDDVSFVLPRGGALAIVGESGSGKTTTARCLIGVEQPTSGRIVVGGIERVPGRASASERRRRSGEMQMVYQDPYASLDPRQRVGHAVEEVIGLHSSLDSAARSERATHLLRKVGLTDEVASAYPRRLSGGQRQRVTIARALAAEPQVIVFDEAVASLDVSIQAHILNLLADLRATSGVAYLFISHDLGVVRHVSDTVLVMRHGVVVERGPTADVLEHPQHRYTRGLIAAIPRPGWEPERAVQTLRAAEV